MTRKKLPPPPPSTVASIPAATAYWVGSGAELIDCFKAVAKAVAKDDCRYGLNGYYVHVIEKAGGHVARVVATDGHRLHWADTSPGEGRAGAASRTLVARDFDPRTLGMARAVLTFPHDREILIGEGKRAELCTPVTVNGVDLPVIGGEFPAYQDLLNPYDDGNHRTVVVETKALIAALKLGHADWKRRQAVVIGEHQLAVDAKVAELKKLQAHDKAMRALGTKCPPGSSIPGCNQRPSTEDLRKAKAAVDRAKLDLNAKKDALSLCEVCTGQTGLGVRASPDPVRVFDYAGAASAVTFGVQARYMIDALQASPTPRVSIRVQHALLPLIVRGGYVGMIVMPMRLD